MTPTTTAINDLLGTLEEEDLKTVISFIQFLSTERKKERLKNSKSVLHEIQGIFSDNKGWDSEEDMINDMASFRKERIKS